MADVVVDYETLSRTAGEMSQAGTQIEQALTGSQVGSVSVNAATLDEALTYFARAMKDVASSLGGEVASTAQSMQFAVLWFTELDTRLADQATVPTPPVTVPGESGADQLLLGGLDLTPAQLTRVVAAEKQDQQQSGLDGLLTPGLGAQPVTTPPGDDPITAILDAETGH